jgi:hypothetical protein
MPFLRNWSFARVLLACVAWIVLSVVVIALWFFLPIFGTSDAGSGSAGIGAVSGGIAEPVLLVPVAPPIMLILAWTYSRWRQRQ